MNTQSNTTHLEHVRGKLSTLWVFLLFNMVFADIFSFMYPGALQQIMTGNTDGTHVTPVFLLIAAAVTEIPIAMVFLSRLLKNGVNRWVNTVGGVITIVWVVALGSMTAPYIFFASIEVVCSLAIVWLAWRWHKPEAQPSLVS